MLVENGGKFGHFKEAVKKNRRVIEPAVYLATLGVVILSLQHANDFERRDTSVTAQVRQAYPRKISEGDYESAKKEIAQFDLRFADSAHEYIDPATLTLKVPMEQAEPILKARKLIKEEDLRSEQASKLTSELFPHRTQDKIKANSFLSTSVAVLTLLSLGAVIRLTNWGANRWQKRETFLHRT